MIRKLDKLSFRLPGALYRRGGVAVRRMAAGKSSAGSGGIWRGRTIT